MYSEWKKKLRALKSIITLDEVCRLFSVETIESFQDRLIGNGDGVYHAVYTDAIREGLSEKDAEERASKAETDEIDERIRNYRNAVVAVAEKLFGEHNLLLEEIPKTGTYRVIPKESWKDSARQIMETVNGVGMFYFSSVKEFCDSGPYTPRQATLTHLHHIRSWGEVYGGGKASTMVDNRLRY